MSRRLLFALVLVSFVLAACGGGGESPASDSDLQFCVDETNRYRAMDGKGPIARSAKLEAFAATGARVDTEAEQAHKHFGDAFDGTAFAENECPSFLGWRLGDGPTAVHDAIGDCIKAFYDEGPGEGDAHGHYNNLMSDNAAVGCGVYVVGDEITITQDFGPE